MGKCRVKDYKMLVIQIIIQIEYSSICFIIKCLLLSYDHSCQLSEKNLVIILNVTGPLSRWSFAHKTLLDFVLMMVWYCCLLCLLVMLSIDVSIIAIGFALLCDPFAIRSIKDPRPTRQRVQVWLDPLQTRPMIVSAKKILIFFFLKQEMK